MASESNTTTKPPMGWEGVGPKMGLALAPWLAAAIGLRIWLPDASAIPGLPDTARLVIGGVVLVAGLAFWLWSAIHFVRHFFTGKLVTDGPFAWCRNPIYASFIVMLIPAAALLANAWPLLAVDVVLYVVFRRFIGAEDRALAGHFGDAYETYRRAVGEVLPVPPRLRAAVRSKAAPWLPHATE
jgi:protein-S-isoprenylcysteine O-methyltransferase Ste14